MEHTQLPTLSLPGAQSSALAEAGARIAHAEHAMRKDEANFSAAQKSAPLAQLAKVFTFEPRDPSHDYSKLSTLIGQHHAAELRLQLVGDMVTMLEANPDTKVRILVDEMFGNAIEIPLQVAMRILTDAQHEARHQADSYAVKLGIAQQSIP